MTMVSDNTPYVRLTKCQLNWKNGQRIELPELTLEKGETLGVMGPSGCGKSTWLRWLLGLKQTYVESTGRVLIAGQDLSQLPIEKRGIGLVMQEQTLFPHYTVADNLTFALAQQKLSRQARQQVICQQLERIGLADYAQRKPEQLSGGERARIALLRAALAKPRLILLDEPFNGLDQTRRQQVCQWTYDFLAREGIAAIIVSHDPNDLNAAQQQLTWPQPSQREVLI